MGGTANILIVDDEKRALELLRRTLRKTGEVDLAASGEEAIEMLDRKRYDLVISDQNMPGLKGVDVLSIAAERNEICGRVLLTGYADLEATVAAINRGRVHAYLHKPCSPDDLLMVVGNVLQRVSLSQENLRLLSVVTEQNEELKKLLTDLEQAQAAALASERLAAIGKMIAMVVHDLRTPIAVVHAAGAEVVAEAEENKLEDVVALGRDVVAEADRMRCMCEDLLSVTHATEGEVTLSPEPIDQAVEMRLGCLRTEADKRSIAIEADLCAPCEVELDPDRFRRLLENLIHNALEAVSDGGTVRVATRLEEGCAVLTVSDDGPGVPPELKEVVFEPFTTGGRPGGTGLGLAIARKVAEDHRGSIALRSSDAGGAEFEIRFPVAPDS
ncbi:MAG: hybrid sensor histidine kinase/response regulator [Myxococcales bacterium]|nr:hybrid sensor histidine kinase/response regulator [Myxococcales bacterium]